MRVFASLPIPADVRRDLSARLPPPPAGMRLIPPSRWHLTLAFYGNLDDGRLRCLVRNLGGRLAPSSASRRFATLRVDGAGQFSRRVAYLRVVGVEDGDERTLQRLARDCRAAGAACGVPDTHSQQAFHGHVTVGRARRGGLVDDQFVDQVRSLSSRRWVADELELMSSQLGATVRYDALRSFSLAR